MTIKEVKEYLLTLETISDLEKDSLNEDTRVGVQKAIASRKKVIMKEQEIRKRFIRMNEFENEFSESVVCGIDEAGRGPLAGEVVASAVVLGDTRLYGLDDSKQLNNAEKGRLYDLIQETCHYGIGIATVEEIDRLNIYEATRLAMQRAVEDLGVSVDHMLVDAMTLNNGIPETSIIKGDARSNSIAAASIIAKVYRDSLMAKHGDLYPKYDFEKNSGYGTKAHIEALRKYGVTPIHRQSFRPVSDVVHNLFDV